MTLGIYQPCSACGAPSPFTTQLTIIRREADRQQEQLLLQASQQHLAQTAFCAAEIHEMKKHSSLLPEEEAALASREVVKIDLQPSRHFAGLTPHEIQFRIVESQFLRMLDSSASKQTVTKVEYIVNPTLYAAYEAKRALLTEACGAEQHPVLAFHGTTVQHIESIVLQNFDVQCCRRGRFGAGIYFSECTRTAMAYGRGQQVLLSKVLLGREFQCPGQMNNQPLKAGFDSHRSPDGNELVVFDQGQILPCYVVNFA